MSFERFVAAAFGSVVLFAVANGAHAFDLQLTPAGEPVRWQADEVVFDLSGLDAAPQARGAVVVAARRALETWSAAGGPVLVEGSGHDAIGSIRWAAQPGDPGVNSDVLGETHLSFDMDTGAIQRAEIVINGAGFRWATTDDGCSDAFDLESTLAHEIGHALGLRHSAVADATMFTRPAPCAKERRDLASDDVDGITALYTAAPADEPNDAAMGGCSAAGGKPSTTLLLLLVLAAAMLARSRFFMRG